MHNLDSLLEHILRLATPEQMRILEENLNLWVATVKINSRPQNFDSFETDCAALSLQWQDLMGDIRQIEFYSTVAAPPEEPVKESKQSWLTPKTRFEIFQRDGFRCQLCGATAKHRARLEVDHKIPRSRGGSTTHENLWTLCLTCNRGKRDKIIP